MPQVTQKPKMWWEVYRNDEEKRLFVGKDGSSGLIRSQFDWRSTDALAKESGLSKKRVEEILDHYAKAGLVLQNSKDPEKWGYWEKVGTGTADKNLVKQDHDARIDKAGGAKKASKPAVATKP